MLTNYTAAEISARIASLVCLLDVLHGERKLLPETQEVIIKDALEALEAYREWLQYRDTITDAMVKADESSENPIFCERVYKRRINFISGKEE